MAELLVTVSKWLARELRLLLLIVAVLVVGSWLRVEWDQLALIEKEIATQATLMGKLRAGLVDVDAEIARDAAAWRERIAAQTRPLRQQMDTLGARIERAAPSWQAALERFSDLERQAREARSAASRASADVDALERQLYFWDKFLNPVKLARLEAARAQLLALRAQARIWEQARDSVAPRIAGSPVQALQDEQAKLSQDIERLSATASPRHADLAATRESAAHDVAAVEALLGAQRERVARDPLGRLIAMVRAQLPLALGILAGALALPVLIKAFFYFVLAPLAGRLAPVIILPDEQVPPIAQPLSSAVSVPVDIAAGEELLVHSDYLQSSSRAAGKRTQWFLDARLPFSSLASGMVALTRIRPGGEQATRVVVSSQADALGEVGVVELPDGAALVLQPRALAGVVKPAAQRLRITRHWRLRSPHAWLTLQLRYIVFHGPCRLILKGCRGVRSEEPQPSQPRLINQSATLGFSANLAYKTTRCETFVAYLRGKEDLFNDLFAGGPGRFFYEEMPADGRRAGITGRGLGGLSDAVLKAFGV